MMEVVDGKIIKFEFLEVLSYQYYMADQRQFMLNLSSMSTL